MTQQAKNATRAARGANHLGRGRKGFGLSLSLLGKAKYGTFGLWGLEFVSFTGELTGLVLAARGACTPPVKATMVKRADTIRTDTKIRTPEIFSDSCFEIPFLGTELSIENTVDGSLAG